MATWAPFSELSCSQLPAYGLSHGTQFGYRLGERLWLEGLAAVGEGAAGMRVGLSGKSVGASDYGRFGYGPDQFPLACPVTGIGDDRQVGDALGCDGVGVEGF